MTTYIIAVAVDGDELVKMYKKLGAPIEDVKSLVANEIRMSGKLEIIRIDRVELDTDKAKDDVAV